MIINIKNKNVSTDTPLELSKREFWQLFLTIRNTNQLTGKEIDVLSDHIVGEAKELKGNYKTYVDKLLQKNISLEKRTTPTKSTFQIKINVT
jgi:hypothetical protein